jgi:hypothetical protein
MSITARHSRRLVRALCITSGCIAFAAAAVVATAIATAADGSPAGRSAAAATSIANRTHLRQHGPVIVIAARLRAPHPYGSGMLILRSAPGGRELGQAHPGGRGIASFIVTLTNALPGAHEFTIAFAPYHRTRYLPSTSTVRVLVQTPLEYPFARARADRPTTKADRLEAFTSDGAPCSTGCRPAGAIDGWPLKPFHEPHALRAGLNEHRPSGFHIGIDIQAKDWSEVYAIQPGRAHIISASWPDARVQVGNYIYWHVKPRVREGQLVTPYETVLGHVLRSMGHLHFTELDASGRALNPLRPGGRVLAPYEDDEPPVIAAPHLLPDERVTVEAFDPQSFRTRTRYLTPVLAPAALAYRLWHADGTPHGPLQWTLRGTRQLEDSLVSRVFTSRAHEPGYLCFATRSLCKPLWEYWLAGGLAPPIDIGAHHGERLTVYAWDWAGNTTARDVLL